MNVYEQTFICIIFISMFCEFFNLFSISVCNPFVTELGKSSSTYSTRSANPVEFFTCHLVSNSFIPPFFEVISLSPVLFVFHPPHNLSTTDTIIATTILTTTIIINTFRLVLRVYTKTRYRVSVDEAKPHLN